MEAKEAPPPEAPRLSFAAAAAVRTEEVPLRAVQVEGHVVLKVIKHCRECMPALVTGQLLGLDIGATLEVTDCFPFPVRPPPSPPPDLPGRGSPIHARAQLSTYCGRATQARADTEEGAAEADGANYQLEMMRCLREVNVDNNTVGW